MAWAVAPCLRAGDDADALGLRETAELGPVAVVEDPRLVRVVDRLGRTCRAHDEVERFVVGGDEDVHRDIACQRRRIMAFPQPPGTDGEDERVDEAVRLGEDEGQCDPPRLPVHGGEPAPDDVVHAGDRGEQHDEPDQGEASRRPLRLARDIAPCALAAQRRLEDHRSPSVDANVRRSCPPGKTGCARVTDQTMIRLSSGLRRAQDRLRP